MTWIEESQNYREGRFHNIEFTPTLTEGHSMFGVISDMLFKRHPRLKPNGLIPSVRTDINNLPDDSDVLIWFGHSSYFIQIDGIRYLIDPVFSGNASPIPFTNRSFGGSDIYSAYDMPAIDILVITHDHYDHLDRRTVVALRERVHRVVCGLGVGSHLEAWGYDSESIVELDWYEHTQIADGITVHSAPARHFSGRGFVRNNTLWSSFVLETRGFKVYIGGDSGYGSHFKGINQRFGAFDFVILDSGQYNDAWKAIHMSPSDTLQACYDLSAKRLFPVHTSKFVLSSHQWDEPLNLISSLSNGSEIQLVTPMIGQPVFIKDTSQVFSRWWNETD